MSTQLVRHCAATRLIALPSSSFIFAQTHADTYTHTDTHVRVRVVARHVQAMSSAEQKELMSMFTDTMPLRVRDIWVMHQPWYFTMFWNMVRPFLKKKLTKRVHMLGNNLERMYEAIDPAVLPPDVGGTLQEDPNFVTDSWIRHIDTVRDCQPCCFVAAYSPR